jgi:hypothetical protein
MRTCPKCGQSYADASQFCPTDGAALVERADQTGGDPRLGTLVDRYRLLDLLGEGGMGTVYKAEHTLIGRPVALKLLRAGLSDSTEAIERFFREARAANEVQNEHIVQVTDFGQLDDGANFLVMELLSGRSLRDLLNAEAPLSPPRAARLVAQMADGLAAAHAKNVIHRDLKPANIQLVQRDTDPEYVKLLDFGIAKIAEQGANLTKTGAILGTPAYMSPEQASSRPVDQRTDIYALGVILYEILVGQPPFTGNNPAQVLVAHLSTPVPTPREHRPDLPEALEALVLSCLEKDPDNRPQSMEVLARQLRAWMKEAGHEGFIPTIVMPAATSATIPAAQPVKGFSGDGLAAAGDAASQPTLPATAVHEGAPSAVLSPATGAGLPVQAPAQEQDSIPPTVIKSGGSMKWLVLGGVGLALAAGLTLLLIPSGEEGQTTRRNAGVVAKKELQQDAGVERTDAAKKLVAIIPEPRLPKKTRAQRPTTWRKPRHAASAKKPAEATESHSHSEAPAESPDPPTKPEAQPAPKKKTMIRVTSIPPGARIFDKFSKKGMGKAPLRFPTSDQGFTLILKKKGHRPYHLDVRPHQTGPVKVRLVALPPHQRTESFTTLNQMLRTGQISFSEWRMRRQALSWERNKKLEAIQRRFRAGEISREERKKQALKVKNRYR